MSTKDTAIKQSIEDYSSSIIRVLNEILDLLNSGKVTIYFDTHGGEPLDPYIAYKGQSIGILPTPVKNGYAFQGWYLTYHYNPFTKKETYSNEIENYSEVDLTSGIVLHAKWDYAYYTIYFDPAGGSVTPTSKKVQYNHAYGELPIATSPIGVFSYWLDENDEEVNQYTILSSFGDKILTAVYGDIEFSLSFNYTYHNDISVAGELGLENPIMVPSSERFGLGNYTQDARSNLSAKGFNFVGWSESSYNPDVVPMVKLWEDTTVYSYWKPNKYILRYCNELGTVLSDQIFEYSQPEYLLSPSDLLDSYASSKLSAWKYSADHVDNINLKEAEDKTFKPDQMVCNLLSSNHAVCPISALFNNGVNSYQVFGNYDVKNVKQSSDYVYYAGDKIFCSAFNVTVLNNVDEKYYTRTPTKVEPTELSSSGNVKFYYGQNKYFEYYLNVKEKEIPVQISLLLGDGQKRVKTDYVMGDYPDLTYLSVQEITNYGNTYIYTDNYTYSPTSALYSDGVFSVSCLSEVDGEPLSTFKIDYTVSPVISKLSIVSPANISSFIEGDYFRLSSMDGLSVRPTYLDGSLGDLSNALDLSSQHFDFYLGGEYLSNLNTGICLSVGTYQLKIQKFQGKKPVSVSYQTNVDEDVGELVLTEFPDKFIYFVDDVFDKTGISGYIQYKNHGVNLLSSDDFFNYSTTFYIAGVQPVDLYYGDAQTTISVGVCYKNLAGMFGLTGTAGREVSFNGLRTRPENGNIAVDYGFNRTKPTIENGIVDYGDSLRFGYSLSDNTIESYTYGEETNAPIISVYTQYQTDKDIYIDVDANHTNKSFATYVNKIYGNVPNYFLSGAIARTTSPKSPTTIANLPYEEFLNEKIGDYAFASYNRLTALNYDGNYLSSIGDYAFYDNNIKVFVPYNIDDKKDLTAACFYDIENIGRGAFQFSSKRNTGMSGLYFYDCTNLKTIQNYAFFNHSGISSFYASPALSLDLIGVSAFANCSAINFDIAGRSLFENVETIGKNAFRNSGDSRKETVANHRLIDLKKCKTLGDGAFYNFKNFKNCSLKFNNTIEGLGNACLAYTNLSAIEFSNDIDLKYIPNRFAMGSAGIQTMDIPESVEYIGMSAFYGNTKLYKVFIPDSVITIGAGAFKNCDDDHLSLFFEESKGVLSNEYGVPFTLLMSSSNLTDVLKRCKFKQTHEKFLNATKTKIK